MENFYTNEQAVKRYIETRDSGRSRNQIIEEKAFVKLLDDPKGTYCLDLGCAYGYYSRLLAQKGAKVLGIDKAELMISEARKRSSGYDIEYDVEAMEDASFPAETFDLVISNLAFHYVQDVAGLLQRIYTWQKRGGSCVFTIEHPILTANKIQTEPQWVDPAHHTGWIVADYFRSGERFGFFGLKYHKTLEEYSNAIVDAGYQLVSLAEPAPDADAVRDRPDLLEDLHRPLFLAFKCRKGN